MEKLIPQKIMSSEVTGNSELLFLSQYTPYTCRHAYIHTHTHRSALTSWSMSPDAIALLTCFLLVSCTAPPRRNSSNT